MSEQKESLSAKEAREIALAKEKEKANENYEFIQTKIKTSANKGKFALDFSYCFISDNNDVESICSKLRTNGYDVKSYKTFRSENEYCINVSW